MAWTCLTPSGALADTSARRLVPLLADSGPGPRRPHPLADEEGRIPLLVRLPPGGDAKAHGLLPVAPGLGALHLDPSGVGAYAAAHPGWRVSTAPPRRPMLDLSGDSWTRATPFRATTGLDGFGVVVGIIDTGIDVRHPDFRRADGATRIAWLLRREPPIGKHPELEHRFGCTDPAQSPCAIYAAADLDALLAKDAAPGDPSGHGTHVAGIAAGNGGVSLTSTPTYIGVAPAATLVVAAPGRTGFSDPDILNAARFVFDRADALGMPAVVNASLGSAFGPHDGTSELERGLAAMVGEDSPGRALVVAAGNDGQVFARSDGRGPYGTHTEVALSPYGLTRVPVVSPGASGTVSGAGYVWITFDAGDDVAVGLEGPTGMNIPLIEPGEDRGDHSDDVRSGVVNAQSGDGGIPDGSRGAIVSWFGSWPAGAEIAVLLRGRGHARLWVTPTGDAASGLGLVFPRARRSGTVSVPATHPDLLAVGCTVNRRAWPMLEGDVLVLANTVLDSVCPFSGAGPSATGVMKPDILAPGMFVASSMSRDVDPRTSPSDFFVTPGCPSGSKYCSLVDDTHAVSSGTSMASPQVAGAIALLLQRDPTLTQSRIRRLLQGSVSRASGSAPFDVAAGPGRLDLMRTLELLDGRDLPTEADAEQSWFNLSADYLRPDPKHAVEGILEVRASDGSVVEPTPEGIRLEVTGARIGSPLTRVAPGLWRFAVAADEGTGGRVARVAVRIAGASVGVSELPIAIDPWRVETRWQAVGGCAAAASARGTPWGRRQAALACAAMLSAIAGRRARRSARRGRPDERLTSASRFPR